MQNEIAKTTVALSKELTNRIRPFAQAEDRSVNAFVRRLCEKECARRESRSNLTAVAYPHRLKK